MPPREARGQGLASLREMVRLSVSNADAYSSDSRRLDQFTEENQEAMESRRQAEKAFAGKEAKYGQFFETAPVGIYEIDLHESRIISVNKAMCHYTGYTREEFLARVDEMVGEQLAVGKERD